jgi:2-aminoadipate transaminase
MLPPIQLDHASEIPIYRQLYDKIKELIRQGTIGRGERLPATRELAGMLGLNRATVSAAYELLEAEGLLKGHVGRGSFVNGTNEPNAPWIDWSQFQTDTVSWSVGSAAISFATSRPADDLFPLEEFRASCREILESPALARILQLGSPLGYAPLRSYLRRECHAQDDVLVTSGCQQAIDLIQRVVIRPGDTVVLEDPVYPGLRNVLAPAGARLIGVPVGPVGIELEELERVLQRERPKLLVITPNFQNPTGTALSLAARQSVLRMARDYRTILVENDIYSDLRYDGEPLPSLKQMDPAGDVVHLGSFSKIAFPGLRIGWVIAPKALVSQLAVAKQWCDLHSDNLSQAVLYRFAESGRLAAHLARIIEAGRARLDATLDSCERSLPPGSRFTRPQGGMNLWVRLPDMLDAGELLPRAERAGVSYLPGRYFAVSRTAPNCLRLSFAGLPPERIREGIAVLGDLFLTELERVQAARLEPAAALV